MFKDPPQFQFGTSSPPLKFLLISFSPASSSVIRDILAKLRGSTLCPMLFICPHRLINQVRPQALWEDHSQRNREFRAAAAPKERLQNLVCCWISLSRRRRWTTSRRSWPLMPSFTCPLHHGQLLCCTVNNTKTLKINRPVRMSRPPEWLDWWAVPAKPLLLGRGEC